MSQRPRTIALVGLSGSGKSTVGPQLASRLGWSFADTDIMVEQRTGQSVGDVITVSEAHFREMELDALKDVLSSHDAVVIACGGGLMAQPAAQSLFDGIVTVWLDAPDSILLERLGDAADRPLLADDPPQRLAERRAQRQHVYERATVHIYVGNMTVKEVVNAIVDSVTDLPMMEHGS